MNQGALVLIASPYQFAAMLPTRPEFASVHSAAEIYRVPPLGLAAKIRAYNEWKAADDDARRQLDYAADCEGE